jgi:hypothetical protein
MKSMMARDKKAYCRKSGAMITTTVVELGQYLLNSYYKNYSLIIRRILELSHAVFMCFELDFAADRSIPALYL